MQRRVGAVVDGLRARRLEKEGQVDPGRDEDQKRVERDLAEEEGPVIGKDVSQGPAQGRAGAGALVDDAHDPADHDSALTPPQDAPTGPDISPAASSRPAS